MKRICTICGKEFETHRAQKACSPECRNKLYRKTKELRQLLLQETREDMKKRRCRNKFGSFDRFAAWVKKQLRGGVVQKYATFESEETDNGQA